MNSVWLNLIVDGAVALLLLGAIPSFWVLSRRLKNMQMGQDGMRQLIEGLNIATEQARRAISDLKLAAAHAGQELEGQIKASRQMADELALMVDAGDNLAGRLEGAIAGARAEAPQAVRSDDGNYPEELDMPSGSRGPGPRRTDADRDLLKTLKSIR